MGGLICEQTGLRRATLSSMFRVAQRGSGLFLTRTSLGAEMPGWLAFRDPVRTLVAQSPEAVREALEEAEGEVGKGRTVAGFLAYEAAPAFDGALRVHEAGGPLAVLSVYDAPPVFYRTLEPVTVALVTLRAAIGKDEYLEAFRRVKTLIGEGATYQVNLTFPLEGMIDGDPLSSFAALAGVRPPPFATYFEHPEGAILSLSPELFFERRGEHVVCRPMKGTAPRHAERDADLSEAARLVASEKNRAENLMIADMVRNDLGRVAEIGSVVTPKLFEIERFDTVWQMSSEVHARFGGSLLQLLDAIYPCASVTGAPKVKAMETIRELEGRPRGIYTGALGYFGRDEARFSVPIRTLSVATDGRATYGVGSGVVWDSDGEEEWRECLLKAERLGQVPEPFAFLETMRAEEDGEIRLLMRHLDRLRRSASFDEPEVRHMIEDSLERLPAMPHRVRLTLSPTGVPRVAVAPLGRVAASVSARLAEAPLSSTDPLLRIKTTCRDAYERELSRLWDADDVLFWNERGEATEFSIGNLVVRRGDRWITPPVESGLLPGVCRAELLDQGRIHEGVVSLEEVRNGAEVARINALRGWQSVRILASRA
ncbi:bifunctional aminodeoxychorismate synthase component I/aminotransferase [bacterium]|nr:MAG: bifunctional aminodeoxychorismate synthase component I/aminotransferase [bacterium]